MNKKFESTRFASRQNKQFMTAFNYGERYAFYRRVILITVFFALWTILAFSMHPLIGINHANWIFRIFSPSSNPILFLLQKATSALFSVDVLVIILIILNCWLFSLDILSLILAKWYGIKRIKDARDFLTATSFGRIILPQIQIKNGEMLITRGSPWVLKLGGPAEYSIPPGNFVIMQKKSGKYVLINSCLSKANKTGNLDPFERIINTYKIQDIEVVIECEGTTKDGVPFTFEHGKIKLTWMETLTSTEQLHLIRDWFGDAKHIPNTIFDLTKSVAKDAIINEMTKWNSEIIKGKGDLSQLNITEIAQLLKSSFSRRKHLFHIWRHARHTTYVAPLKPNKTFPRFLGRHQIWVYPQGIRYLKQSRKLSLTQWDIKIFNDTIIENMKSSHPLQTLCTFTWNRTGTIQIKN